MIVTLARPPHACFTLGLEALSPWLPRRSVAKRSTPESTLRSVWLMYPWTAISPLVCQIWILVHVLMSGVR